MHFLLTSEIKFIIISRLSGCGEVWYRAWFGSKRPRVRIPTLRPNKNGCSDWNSCSYFIYSTTFSLLLMFLLQAGVSGKPALQPFVLAQQILTLGVLFGDGGTLYLILPASISLTACDDMGYLRICETSMQNDGFAVDRYCVVIPGNFEVIAFIRKYPDQFSIYGPHVFTCQNIIMVCPCQTSITFNAGKPPQNDLRRFDCFGCSADQARRMMMASPA